MCNSMARKIGLVGFGCVAQGFYQLVVNNPLVREQIEIKRICIKHSDKPRALSEDLFTTDIDSLVTDNEIEVVVELIDDASAAWDIITTALSEGKAVVSANKKMIAENLRNLQRFPHEIQNKFHYEAAVGACIPLLKTLDNHYGYEPISKVEGIINGSTNYILGRMFADRVSFEEALGQAQDLGYAESDPKLDIEGFDASHKLSIILFHAFNQVCKPEDILRIGIDRIDSTDVDFAVKNQKTIKLTACCFRNESSIGAFCLPRFVNLTEHLGRTEDAYNAVEISSVNTDKQLLLGKGAGGEATAMAVLADVMSVLDNQQRMIKPQHGELSLNDGQEIDIYVRHQQNIDTSSFTEILDMGSAGGDQFLIGRISLKALKKSPWARHTGNSIIMI